MSREGSQFVDPMLHDRSTINRNNYTTTNKRHNIPLLASRNKRLRDLDQDNINFCSLTKCNK
jgi:hypothetical protein